MHLILAKTDEARESLCAAIYSLRHAMLQVALRRKKHLLALQAVNQGLTLVTAEHPEVHRMIVLLGREVLTPSSTAQNGHAKVLACSLDN